MPSTDVGVEVFHDAYDTTRLRGVSIGRHRHEVDLDAHWDRPCEIRHEDEGTPKDPDHEQVKPGVVKGNALPEATDDLAEFSLADQDRADPAVSIRGRCLVVRRHARETLPV